MKMIWKRVKTIIGLMINGLKVAILAATAMIFRETIGIIASMTGLTTLTSTKIMMSRLITINYCAMIWLIAETIKIH